MAVARMLVMLATLVADTVQSGPPRPRASIPSSGAWVGWVDDPLDVSSFPGREAGGATYDVLCPHTGEPNPAIVVVPDRGAPRSAMAEVAGKLAGTGFVTIVVLPADLDAVLAAIQWGGIGEPREPGCAIHGALGVWATGGGADDALAAARAQAAAGHPLGGVVALYPHEGQLSPVTPTLVIDRVARPGIPRAEQLVIDGGDDDARAELALVRSAQWLRALVEGDAAAGREVASWGPAPTAIAGPPRPAAPAVRAGRSLDPLISLPLELAYTSHRDGGFAIGTRPELVLAARHTDGEGARVGDGGGIYGELIDDRGDRLVGGGVTYVHYGSDVAFAPSFGIYDRAAGLTSATHGVSASLFAGRRGFIRWGPFDGPVGLRVDARFATDGSGDRAVMVSAELDAVTVAAFVVAIAEIVTGGVR